MMEGQNLTCFLSLADHGSYAKAGRALGMMPSEVAAVVRSLEVQLGVLLVSRAGRMVQLTRAGELLRAQSPWFIQNEARLREQMQGQGRRLLRVAVSEGVSPTEVTARLQTPDAEVSDPLVFTLKRVPLVKQYAGLARGAFDAGLSHVQASQKDEGLEVEAAWREPLVALLPADHWLASYKTLSLPMLSASRIFIIEGGYVEQIEGLLRDCAGIELKTCATPGEVMLAMQQEKSGGIGLMGATQWPPAHNRAQGPVGRPVVDAQTGEPLLLTTYLRRPRQTLSVQTEDAMAGFTRRLQREVKQPSKIRNRALGKMF